MVSDGPEAVRARVRDWLHGLLEAEGATVALADPSGWGDWDEERRR